MILQVEIIDDDLGWKGTWYRKGERHYVRREQRSYIASAWSAIDTCGGIAESDAVELKGVWQFIKCACVELQLFAGRRVSYIP